MLNKAYNMIVNYQSTWQSSWLGDHDHGVAYFPEDEASACGGGHGGGCGWGHGCDGGQSHGKGGWHNNCGVAALQDEAHMNEDEDSQYEDDDGPSAGQNNNNSQVIILYTTVVEHLTHDYSLNQTNVINQ